MPGVDVQAAGIQAFAVFRKLEVDLNVVFHRQPGAVRRAPEFLFDGQSRNEVQVDFLRHVEYGFLHEIGGIERDVEVSRESEGLRVEGHEGEVDTPLPVHHERVQHVILVVIGPDGRERTDEPLQEQRYVVLEDVHFAENFVQELVHAVAGKDFVDAGRPVSFDHPFLSLWRQAVVHGFHPFLFRYGEDGGAGFQRVDEFLQKVELAFLAVGLGLEGIVVFGEKDFLVVVVAVEVVCLGVACVARLNDAAHEVHCRIAAFAVSFPFGLHGDFIQRDVGGGHWDGQVDATPLGHDGDVACDVSHIRNLENAFPVGYGEREASVDVGGGFHVAPFQHHGGVGQSFAGEGVRHHAFHSCVLCLCGTHGTQ